MENAVNKVGDELFLEFGYEINFVRHTINSLDMVNLSI